MQRPIILLLLGSLLAFPALAEKADRNKPVHLEADRLTVDDAKKVHILQGNVRLSQGTLIIRCEKLVVTQDKEGFQKGIATGGPGGLARFRQKREGLDEYIDGEAERIIHDDKAGKTEFFQRAYVKSGHDEVRGQYISYDGHTENYLVTSGPDASSPAGQTTGRVHAVIQPKSRPESSLPPPSSSSPSSSQEK